MTITAPTMTQLTSYIGQTWYDFMGNAIEETGHSSPATAAQRILDIDKSLAGKWSFAVVKTKVREGGVDRWVNAVLFPDGKTRKLLQGEVSVSQRTRGVWINLDDAKKAAASAKITTEIKLAPDTRFPWRSSAAETKLQRFKTLVEFEGWLIQNAKPDTIVFLFVPGTHVRAPDEEVLFAYLAVLPK